MSKEPKIDKCQFCNINEATKVVSAVDSIYGNTTAKRNACESCASIQKAKTFNEAESGQRRFSVDVKDIPTAETKPSALKEQKKTDAQQNSEKKGDEQMEKIKNQLMEQMIKASQESKKSEKEQKASEKSHAETVQQLEKLLATFKGGTDGQDQSEDKEDKQ